jgi:IS30 family transposase
MSRMLRHRGKEFARARQIQERLGIPACSCAPHHPWEKGTTENANGLLRDFFPKGRSLDGATDAEANAAYAMLS